MIAKVYSAIPNGYNGSIVEVEGDISRSLPSFNIVGMANKTISEARERVRSAIVNSGLTFPTKKVTISLAPAELTKNGSGLDLPIALNILILSHQLLPNDLTDKIFVGELSLDGSTRPVRGIINIVEAAKQAGFTEVYVPIANLSQSRLISGIRIIGVTNLRELLLHLHGVQPIHNPSSVIVVKNTNTDTNQPVLDHIRGQDLAKRALTIAIAGHHNILLSGPPGAGKTMLAQVATNLLPSPTLEEQITLTKIHSLYTASEAIITRRPFRSPHHTASSISIIGGGRHAAPGEITLAHHGILFLDELPEYSRSVLEALRQPLEDKTISISRADEHITYPADFMLIATMNPCPCGYLHDPSHECKCTPNQIEKYRKKISGPILDRIDLIINVERCSTADLITSQQSLSTPNVVKNTITEETTSTYHSVVKNNITDCIQRQFQRYRRSGFYNSSLSSHEIDQYIKLQPASRKLLEQAIPTLKLSARSYFKVIKVAQTIADLDHSTEVKPEHISESLALRQQLN